MALIPPNFLNTVVALGAPSSDGSVEYYATGFLYGYPIGTTGKDDAKQYRIYLVTNRHVFQKASGQLTQLQARFTRPMGTGASIYALPLRQANGSALWTVHPDAKADVAVLGINAKRLHADGIEYRFFLGDKHTFTLDQARANEVSEGDGVFVLGFPLGEAGNERNY